MSFRRLLILLVIGHFLVGLALSFIIHEHSKNGVLEGTDEVRYVYVSRDLAHSWRNGDFMSYASMKFGDPHPGYYYVLAALDYTGINHPLAWRMINICIAFIAILLWGYALEKNGESEKVQHLYLALLLLSTSMLFMSSWIIREAWLYMFSGFVSVNIVSLTRSSTLMRQWKALGGVLLALVLIGFFRGYEAVIVGVVAIMFVFSRTNWKKAFLLSCTTICIGLMLNYPSVVQYVYVITGLNLHDKSLLDFTYANYEHIFQFYQNFLNENRFGNSVIDPSAGWFHKVWLFFSFPLPWQAQSPLQKLAIPETLVFLALLPGMLYGIYLKMVQRDTFAIFVLAWFLSMAVFYISVNVNLGTMYRHKASLMFMMLYFVAVGVTALYERFQLSRRSGTSCND